MHLVIFIKNRIKFALLLLRNTVELRFNEVPRDWGIVRYIENLDLTNFGKKNKNVRYIEVS